MKYGHLFDGTLGAWSRESYDIELKEDATPFHSSAYPIPKVHEKHSNMRSSVFVKLAS
jgi:hypothetical protein